MLLRRNYVTGSVAISMACASTAKPVILYHAGWTNGTTGFYYADGEAG